MYRMSCRCRRRSCINAAASVRAASLAVRGPPTCRVGPSPPPCYVVRICEPTSGEYQVSVDLHLLTCSAHTVAVECQRTRQTPLRAATTSGRRRLMHRDVPVVRTMMFHLIRMFILVFQSVALVKRAPATTNDRRLNMTSSSLGRRGCSSSVSLYVVSILGQLVSITRW